MPITVSNVKGIAGPRPAASPGAHGLTVVNRAPHPNARKVYVNWMLGPDGQRVFAEISANSARLDLPPVDRAYDSVP